MKPKNNPPREGWYWPWLIIGLLLSGAAGSIGMVIIAVNDPSFAVETNYYQKSVQWDKQMKSFAQSRALGWAATLKLRPHPKRKHLRGLTLTLRDNKQQPITDAKITALAFHNAQASQQLKLDFTHKKDGRYHAWLRVHRRGLWVFRVEASQKGKRFFLNKRVKVQRLTVTAAR